MNGSSLEEALRSQASLLFKSGSPKKTWSMRDVWQPLWSCTSECHVKDAPSPVHHKLPSFFSDKQWDLSGDQTDRADVKLPGFFLNQKWDLGRAASGHSDELYTMQEEMRLCFTLQPSDRFGMVLEETSEPVPSGLLAVSGLDDWSAFAPKAAGGPAIKIGDVILEVNGKRGTSSEMREALVRAFSANDDQSRIINLVVRSRPPAFNLELWRATGKQRKRRLGFVVCAAKSHPTCLKVQGVLEKGLVPSWNATHGSLRICRGDFITHVNGVSQDVEAMSKEMEESSRIGSALRVRVVTPEGEANLMKESSIEEPNSGCSLRPSTWDMQVRGLEDNLSVGSTTASLSDCSCVGVRTPDEE